MAVSAIAAILLPGGRTIHSKLHVPIELHDTSLCSIKDKSAAAQLVRRYSLMVIDEVTMGDKRIYETIDRTLRHLRGQPDKAYGGVVMVYSGDWRQCLPVLEKANEAQIIARTLKRSQLWKDVCQPFCNLLG